MTVPSSTSRASGGPGTNPLPWPKLTFPGGWDRLGLGHYNPHVLGEETEAQGGSGLQPCSRKGRRGPSLGPSFCKHRLAGRPAYRKARRRRRGYCGLLILWPSPVASGLTLPCRVWPTDPCGCEEAPELSTGPSLFGSSPAALHVAGEISPPRLIKNPHLPQPRTQQEASSCL